MVAKRRIRTHPTLPASVRAGSNLNKFAGEIAAALAGVGSKLEAMQERLERNEAGVERWRSNSDQPSSR